MASHAYKEIQLPQLRSFCETARLGSLSAAAKSLGMSQPTVWEQVHALERALGVKLIERHARGCRVTENGRRVAGLATPIVQGMQGFRRNVFDVLELDQSWLSVATTERILVEDLPAPIIAFEQSHPHVQLRFVEARVELVPNLIETGKADFGLTIEAESDRSNPWLSYELAYRLDYFLITAHDHPLSRLRHIRPTDLLGYPLLNSRDSLPDAALNLKLEQMGLFNTQPRRVEARYTAVIRRYAELGFGIGLIVGLPGHKTPPSLHERSMSAYFGQVDVNVVRRKADAHQGGGNAFAASIRSILNPTA